MAENKVSYRKPNGKHTYVLSYRHPVIKDAEGNGKKIQRGTGTGDENKAKELAAQLQELVSNEKWHDRSKKTDALLKFNQIAADAFYDCMPDIKKEYHALNVIPMKTLEEGYPNECLVGMSGSGKTSYLRKRMGTSADAFPTTSNNRTTTCDMEVIISKESMYKLAVQFISRNELEMVLMDNICDSIEYLLKCVQSPADDMELLAKLLNHREMETRLSYLLGMPDTDDNDEEDEDEEDSSLASDQDIFQDNDQNKEEQNKWLWETKDRIKTIGMKYKKAGTDILEMEQDIQNDDEVLDLIDDIINAVIEKFVLLKEGKKTNPRALWPEGWYFETEEYKEFIKKAKLFVGNDYRAWGKLFTPIVKAIRIQGPFIEEGQEQAEPAVIIDGIGLGHTTKSTSIPASVLERCQKSDIIIFIDSASNPMMANTKEALKSLIEYGCADRLIFGFTKMDLVEGSNYRNMQDKKQHIKKTLENYLSYLRKQEHAVLSDLEVQTILNNCIFFSRLDKEGISKLTANGMNEFREKVNTVVSKKISVENVHFQYEALKLYYYLKESTQIFRQNWGEKTGCSAVTGNTVHWTRIRALSRRLAVLGKDHYQELQPLTDFITAVQERISLFINQPEAIIPHQADEEVLDELKRRIKREIGLEFKEFNQKRMWTDKQPFEEWKKAFSEHGKGAGYRRARIMENIFNEAAPYLADIPNLTEEQRRYLSDVINLVDDILKQYGCRLLRFSY